MITVFIDGDACPVKEETFRVAERYQLPVKVVSNQWMKLPANPKIEMKVVSGDFDAADDWIVENCGPKDVVITGDILLAQRCLQKKSRVLGHKGVEFTDETIGDAVATRELMQNLRHFGEKAGSPKPMEKKDRSQFLGKLDQIIQALKRS